MRLLFDQNLSPSLVERLADLFPGSSHVQSEGLDRASDDEVWEHALQKEFTIVSKDEDYSELSVVRGLPPKVIWLLLGNCTTLQIEVVLRARIDEIQAFGADPAVGTLAIR
jgi:predicted nuclease of predicted toxin-antitoxin system